MAKISREERAARQREAQTAAEGRRRQERRRRMAGRIGGGVLALVLLAGAFVYFSRGGAAGSVVAASSSLGAMSSSLPAGSTGNFHKVSTPLRQGSKLVLLFIGAQYCPFCAAERWAIVKALARFGTWSNLDAGHSTSGDSGFGDVPTFDLLDARYSSRYVAFDSKDVADNAGNRLQSLSAHEQALFNRFDPAGSIPLVYVDGYAMTGSDYSPSELQGQSFATVQRDLQRNAAASDVADINGEANLLTAFLCRAGGNQPGGVCTAATIQSIERGIH